MTMKGRDVMRSCAQENNRATPRLKDPGVLLYCYGTTMRTIGVTVNALKKKNKQKKTRAMAVDTGCRIEVLFCTLL